MTFKPAIKSNGVTGLAKCAFLVLKNKTKLAENATQRKKKTKRKAV
jgi:hypothetical protein